VLGSVTAAGLLRAARRAKKSRLLRLAGMRR
jgi:hypothetical protein